MATRSATLYQGEDMTPTLDYTDYVVWEESEFGTRAWRGEINGSSIVIRDPLGEQGNAADLPAGLTFRRLSSKNLFVVKVGSDFLFRGRVGIKSYSRDGQQIERYRQVEVQLHDTNWDLDHIFVHNWARNSETDKERTQGLIASYLAGSPRPTTAINGSNYISSSNLVTLPAHTYTQSSPLTILREISQSANKQFFVTGDAVTGGSLFYDGNDSAAYACTLSISDRASEVNHTTVFAPIWNVGPASTEDGSEQLDEVILFYGTDAEQYVRVHDDTIHTQYGHSSGTFTDSTATTATEATRRANAILSHRRLEDRTYNVTIGPLTDAQVVLIKHGQTIDIKARAIPDADDQSRTMRIVQCRYTTPIMGTWFAHLQLGRPWKLEPYGSGPTLIPQPPTQSTPEVVTGYEFWSWELDPAIEPIVHLAAGAVDGAFVDDDTTDDTSFGASAPYITAGAVDGGRYYKTGGLGGSTESGFVVATPGTVYRVSGYYGYNTSDWGQTPGAAKVEFYSGNYGSETILSTTTVGGGAGNEKVWESFSDDVTAPTGTTMMQVLMNVGGSGSSWDAISIAVITPAVTGDDPAIVIGGPGEGEVGDGTPVTIPIGTVIEHGDLSGKGGTMHDASQIEFTPTGTIAADDVQEAVAEVATDAATALTGHTGDTSDAHDASAISVLDTAANFTGTDVEAVLAELAGGGGGGSLTVEEVDGSPTDSAVTKIIFPNGTVSITSHEATYTPAGGGGGSFTHSYIGYNTIGGTWVTMTTRRVLMKKITLASDGMLQNVAAYVRATANAPTTAYVNALRVAVFNDNAGDPNLILGYGSPARESLFPTDTAATGDGRWFAVAMPIWLPAGSYWIAVQCIASTENIDIAKDASGTDRYYLPNGEWFTDAGFTTVTTTTDKYSIRASIIS